MKKRILVLFSVIILTKNIFAQTPVIDATSIATAIENGYMLYQELQSNLETVNNTYQSLMAIKDQMMSFDLSAYDWEKWDAFLYATDDFMTLQDNLAAVIQNKNMTFGNMRFSLEDLFDGDTYGKLLNEAEQKLDPSNMTDDDRTAFINRHGMSPEHYHTLVNLDIQLTNKAKEVIASNQARKQLSDSVAKMMPEISKQVGDDSLQELQSLQLQTQLMQSQNENLVICAQALIDTSNMQAWLLQKQIEQDNQLKENLSAVSDSFKNYDFSLNQKEVCDEEELLDPYVKKLFDGNYTRNLGKWKN